MPIFHLLLLFAGGLLAGLYASSVGGGGLLALPFLLLTGLPLHIALGTQRLAAVILEFASSIKFYKEKKINFKVALPLGVIAGLGAVVGANFVIAINENILNLVIAGLLVLVYFLFFFTKKKLGFEKHKLTHKHYFLLILCTFLIGIWGGFFGTGFGIFSVMMLVFFGFPFFEGAAMSRVIGFFMSGIAMIIFAQHGLINYIYGITLGLGYALGGWIGIGIALKKGEEYFRGLLALVIIISVIKLVLNFFGINFL
jgi:uncharacterized protein